MAGPTGPTYPKALVAGSNAISNFSVSTTITGTLPPFQWPATVISQYANSPIINQLLANFFAYLDPTANFNAFYSNVWNGLTAVGYGLDLLGRILGISRVVAIPAQVMFFGFQEPADPNRVGFGQAPFFTGSVLTNNFSLSDPAFRLLLLAKALANITDGSIASINQLLLTLFPGRGNAYVIDNQNMTMIYNFNFVLTPVEISIVQNSGVLPRPPGVSATVTHL